MSIIALVMAVIAVLLAGLALVVTFSQREKIAAFPRNASRNYSAAETAGAQRQLCDAYKVAARAVEVDTNGTDRALARIADTNGAVMLDIASRNPALDQAHRDAAMSLSAAYATVTALGSSVVASDTEYRVALDNVIAKDSAMNKVCGGN